MRSLRSVPWKTAAGLAIIAALLTGCPIIRPLSYEFTSADQSGYRNGLFDYLAPGGSPVTEDTSGDDAQRELVEPDVIRRAGNLLYVLNQYRGLTIVDLDTEQLLAQAPTYGYPRDLYLVGDLAYVLVGYATNYVAEGNSVTMTAGSRIFVVDVANPGQPEVVSSFDLTGDFVDSRLVGDVLYAVSANFQWNYAVDGGGDVALAKASSGRWEKDQTSESWVTSVNVADPENIQVADTLSFAGYGSIIQATNYAIFVASSDWYTNTSSITYVDISDPAGAIAVRGACQIRGYIADQYKMDAWNGVLRVVSNTGWQDRNVYVTTVDLANPDALAILGETMIPDAAGEALFATRFDGPRGYIVTYFMVDPLFVLDLSNPAEPKLAGQLEVPGWSVHIEPQGNRLIALGVDDTDGKRRVKVSLFDVSNPAQPMQTDVVSMGDDWSWSSAYSDVKAFTVLDDMLIVPFSGYNDEGSYERLQFIEYAYGNLELAGHVDVQGQVLRSFQYGGAYYGVTTEQLATIQMNAGGPEVVNQLTLAEYVADVQELSPELAVEILSEYEKGATEVRTATPEGLRQGSVEIEGLSNIVASFAYDSSVVLVSSAWDTAGYYMIYVVDCSVPEAPVVATNLRVDVTPFHGGWRWYYDYPVAVMEATVDKRLAYNYWWYPWGDTSDSVFLVDGTLVLRCSAEKYDTTLGDADAGQGLALVDLATGEWKQTVGLGYDNIQAINAANGKLYVSTKNSVGIDGQLRPLCAHFLRSLSVNPVAAGPAVNVPGAFLQYDPASQVLLLEDLQYGQAWDYARTLQSVRWDGGESVTPLDTQKLPDGNSSLLARGNRIYFDAWQDNAYTIGAILTDAEGALTQGNKVEVSETWCSLADAKDASVYVTIGGGAIARYDFSGEPALTDLVPVMSSPQRIRFGATTAYAPLGYAGLARLPL